MVHLPYGDVREAPTSERSFIAGEAETEFRFEITNWDTRTAVITVLGMLPPARLFNSEGVCETKLMASQRQPIRKNG
jgi:hypothetical protein